MYKQKLNELCQKKRWATPAYERRSAGPDHIPMFRASVTVNGLTFDGPEETLFATLKEAQNEAARLAVDYFLSSPSPPPAAPPPSMPPAAISGSSDSSTIGNETRNSFKIQLHNYAKEKSFEIPVYDNECLTIDHRLRFKASVNVGSQTFESPQFFDSLNDAEQDAARLAMAFYTSNVNLEFEGKSYKNHLSEMALKKGLAGPIYKTVSDGPPHMLTFVSTVEIGGETFQGDVMKMKRQAENSAAKIAWMKLGEGKLTRISSGLTSLFRTITIEDVPPLGQVNTSLQSSPLFSLSSEQASGISSGSIEGTSELTVEIEGEEKSKPPGTRVMVFPRYGSSQPPEGARLLPFTDEQWVAVAID